MSLLTVDGCHNYTTRSEADRAQRQIVISDSNYRCDRDDLVPGHPYPYSLDHSGTRDPVWLSDAHPTIAEDVVIR